MNIFINKTTELDFKITEIVTREAFWNLYRPGCVEHLILHNIRKSKDYINELDLLAVYDNEIVGHIISTSAKIIDLQNNEHEVLCVGPLSILPDYQKKGIGSKLIENTIAIAAKMDYCGLILFGNPEYYHRFGFVNAQNFDITTRDGMNFDAFMALELYPDALMSINGKFIDDAVFDTNEDELEEFDKQFSIKEKTAAKINISI